MDHMFATVNNFNKALAHINNSDQPQNLPCLIRGIAVCKDLSFRHAKVKTDQSWQILRLVLTRCKHHIVGV